MRVGNRGEAYDHAYYDEALSEVPRDDRRRRDHHGVNEDRPTLDALTRDRGP